MKKSILYISTVIIVALCGCTKYLDKLPLDSPANSDFITNATEMNLAVTACYNALYLAPTGTSDDIPFNLALECVSDIGWDRNNSGLQQTGLGIATSQTGAISSYWSVFYNGIEQCNYFLSRENNLVGVVDTPTLNTAVGEVHFMRGFYYSYLVELYGAVPLVTVPLSLSNDQLPRTGVDTIVNFILNDLDTAAALLPTKAAAGRATKGAALALASRIALYNGLWQKAADEAKAAMNLGIYSLYSNYTNLFNYKGQSAPEIMFAIQYLIGKKTDEIPYLYFSRMTGGASSKIPVESLVDAYECTDGLTIDKSPLYNPQKPFDNRDPRLGATVVLPQSIFMGYVFETNKDSTLTWNYNVTPAKRVANTDATNAYATFSGFLWRKYTDSTDAVHIYGSAISTILIRYAEVLLNYAEAKIELNQIDQSVYDAINAVRQRPSVNMPPIPTGQSQTALRSIITKERKYEFAGEGLRLFDIRRWKIAEQVMNGPLYGRVPTGYLSSAPIIDENGTPNYGSVANADSMRVIEQRVFNPNRDYLWPINLTELETEKALVQNPNY